MERYVIVKIAQPSQAEFEEYRARENYEHAGTGMIQSGKPFEGTITVHVAANAYTLEIVCRTLRAACVNFSLHTGKEVRRRSKKCGGSTASEARLVELTLDIRAGFTPDLNNTTQEVYNLPEGTNGNTNGCSDTTRTPQPD